MTLYDILSGFLRSSADCDRCRRGKYLLLNGKFYSYNMMISEGISNVEVAGLAINDNTVAGLNTGIRKAEWRYTKKDVNALTSMPKGGYELCIRKNYLDSKFGFMNYEVDDPIFYCQYFSMVGLKYDKNRVISSYIPAIEELEEFYDMLTKLDQEIKHFISPVSKFSFNMTSLRNSSDLIRNSNTVPSSWRTGVWSSTEDPSHSGRSNPNVLALALLKGKVTRVSLPRNSFINIVPFLRIER